MEVAALSAGGGADGSAGDGAAGNANQGFANAVIDLTAASKAAPQPPWVSMQPMPPPPKSAPASYATAGAAGSASAGGGAAGSAEGAAGSAGGAAGGGAAGSAGDAAKAPPQIKAAPKKPPPHHQLECLICLQACKTKIPAFLPGCLHGPFHPSCLLQSLHVSWFR